MLEKKNGVVFRFFFRKLGKCSVIKNIAVLVDLNK
jgi:hypothetical protein